jgi:uncharacterized membrane protein YhhN
MYKNLALAAFGLSVLINSVGNAMALHELSNASKPFIVASLLIWVWVQRQLLTKLVLQLLFTALCFSLIGDILLIFEPKHPLFFMLGLGAFLLAHLSYIILFAHHKKNKAIPWQAIWILVAVTYFFLLMLHLFPKLGALKIPVLIYGLVIVCMLMIALHFFDARAGRLKFCAIGAVLFCSSDTLLALNKFSQPFFSAGMWIMLTYSLAQFCIVWGLIKDADK